MAHNIAFCEYNDCDVQADVSTLIEMFDDDGCRVYICEKCYNIMEDQTGFCAISCQLGYGCDDSC